MFAKDKLVALSGLAQTIRLHYPDNYYAGIWSGDYFVSGLCWTVMRPAKQPTRTELVVLSWSLASMSPQYLMFHEFNFPLRKGADCEVVHVSTSVATADPFGVVADGRLVLRARTVPGRIVRIGTEPDQLLQQSQFKYRMESGTRQLHVHIDNFGTSHEDVLAVLLLQHRDSFVMLMAKPVGPGQSAMIRVGLSIVKKKSCPGHFDDQDLLYVNIE
jgi:hypothetical protein